MFKEVIQMYDPKREYIEHKEDIDNSIHNVLNHGLFINGPEVKELEKQLSEYTGVKHCISVSNGTDAIQVALMALDVGIDDEVITVAHTWISTAEVVSLVNAKPIFIDVDLDTHKAPHTLEKLGRPFNFPTKEIESRLFLIDRQYLSKIHHSSTSY